SECSKQKLVEPNLELDPRLKCWQQMLQQRGVLQQRIQRQTGKRADQVLFNRHVTVDERQKQLFRRMLDTAVRSEGVPLTKPKAVLPARKVDAPECRELRELKFAEPKLRTFEFVGMPQVACEEQGVALPTAESQFMRSPVLLQRIEECEEHLTNIMDFCPEIEKLQVVKQPQPALPPLLCQGEDPMCTISSSSSIETESEELLVPVPVPEKAEPSVEEQQEGNWLLKTQQRQRIVHSSNIVRINGINYGFGENTGLLCNTITLQFECSPYERQVKTLVELENIGSKFIAVSLYQSLPSIQTLPIQLAHNNEFVFDHRSFILQPEERRIIQVMFQPLKVGVKFLQWSMRFERQPFCGPRQLEILLEGRCVAPESFQHRIDAHQQLLVDKGNRQMARRLAKMQALLAPIIDNTTQCPYVRALDEREVFAAQNAGFICQRYADLEALKEIHALIKKPRQPAWDYSLKSLRELISQQGLKQREALQVILSDLITPMRCGYGDFLAKIQANPERERSSYIYVRGILCSTIEEFEAQADSIEQQFYKTEYQSYMTFLDQEEELPDSFYIDWFVANRVSTSKYFKDSLYMQAYSMLCDAVENIVSAIESTVH
ncbi:CG11060, partial [Drosophila busckii]